MTISAPAHQSLTLSADRLLPADPGTRAIALRLYSAVAAGSFPGGRPGWEAAGARSGPAGAAVTRVLAWLDLPADVETTVREQLAELESMAHDRA